MPYNDFVRNVLGGSVPTSVPGTPSSVPGMTAPVQFQTMPGTSVSQAYGASQQAVQANNAAVQVEQQRQQQLAAQAQAQQQQQIEEEKNRHRGGGFFGPVRRAVRTITDYPQTLQALGSNILHNPASLSAWGMGALGLALPSAAILGIPQDYNKMAWGEIIYHIAKDDRFAKLIPFFLPPVISPMYQQALSILQSALPEQVRANIIRAHEGGFKGWSGGNGVWEYAMSGSDDIPPVIRYPMRAVWEIAIDPLTVTGISAATEAVKVGRLTPDISRMSPLEKFAYKTDTTTVQRLTDRFLPHGSNPLQVADRGMRALNAPFDLPFKGIGKASGALIDRTGLGNVFGPNERKLAERNVRSHQSALTTQQRYLEGSTFPVGSEAAETGAPLQGSVYLNDVADIPPGFEATRDVAPDGSQIISLRSQDTGDISQIHLTWDRIKGGKGKEAPVVLVTTPVDQTGHTVATIEDAYNEIVATRQTAINRETNVERPDPFAIPMAQNRNPYDRAPGEMTYRPMDNGGFELTSRTRGRGYAFPDADGTFSIYNEQGDVLMSGIKSASDAYTKIKNEILTRPSINTKIGDIDVGPAFGTNPTGSRPQDIVATQYADTPEGARFNQQLGADLTRPADVIRMEDEATQRRFGASLYRRDLDPETAYRENRPGRTIDTPLKVMAQLKGAVAGQRRFSENFGERETPWPTLWKEDQSQIIATRGQKNDIPIKFRVNDREAAYQAVLDPDSAKAQQIIDYFKKSRAINVNRSDLDTLLIDPSMAKRFGGSKAQRVNYGRVLEANRDAVHNPAREPIAALPESTGPLPGATAIGPSEENMVSTQTGQRFLRNPEDAARLGEDTGKRYAGPIESTPEGVQATYQTGANKGKPVKGSILPSSDQPSIGDTPIYTLDNNGPATGFTTSKGSTYTIGEDGRTIRDKAARPEHPGQVGVQPESHQTVYMTKEDMLKWDILQTEGGMKRYNPVVRGDEAALENLSGKNRGKFVGGSKVSVKLEPEIGLHPVEIWRGDNPFVHFGNDITDITRNTARQEAGEPIRSMLGEQTTIAQPPRGRGATVYQQLVDAGEDPVKRQEATTNLVNRMVGQGATPDITAESVPSASGYKSYAVRGADGAPEASIHVGDDNTIYVTTLAPNDDPSIRNLVARAGDDAKVVVRPGLPDLVGEPMGLTTPRSNPIGPDDRIGDPIYRGWRRGRFSDQVRDALELKVMLPGVEGSKTKAREMRLGDAYAALLARHNYDSKKAFEDASKMIREQLLPKTKAKPGGQSFWTKTLQKWDAFITHQRDMLMFNWATGPVSAALDHLGDVTRAASEGHIRAAVTMMNPEYFRAGYNEAKGVTDAMMNTDQGAFLRGLNSEEIPDINLGTGREETHREGTTQWERYFRSKGLSDKGAKNVRRAASTVLLDGSGFVQHLRSGGDTARRFILYVDAMRRELPGQRDTFFAHAEDLAGTHAGFDVNEFQRGLNEVFSPEDVYIRAVENGLDAGQAEHLSRYWRSQITSMEDVAKKRLNDIFFSYESTKADDILKRIFLFHYWYTRASVAYTRTIIRNPYLYVNYMRAMDAMERDAEGKPSAVKGMIRAFSAPGGFAIFMDPFKLLSTAVTFRQQAYSDGQGGAFDNYLAQTGLFLNPAISAALQVIGVQQNNNPDPFATFQSRRILGGAVNLANAEIGRGMLGAPYQEAMNMLTEDASSLPIFRTVNELMRGTDKNYARDPKANDKVLVRTRIMELVQQQYNIAPGTEFGQWSPQALQALETAYDALDHGDNNPFADQAYKEWAQSANLRNLVTSLVPVGTSLRSDARDNQLNQTRRVPDPNDSTNSFLPIGSAGFDNERDVASAASGDPTSLAVSDAQFDALFPANAAGRMATSADGQTQEDVLSQDQNQLYAQYRDWKKTVGDYKAFREQMERVSPSYRNYMNDLRKTEPYKSHEDALDNAGVSFGAFVVLNGDKVTQFNRNPAATLDMSAMNPSTLGAAAQSEGYSTPQSFDELGSRIQGQLMSYYQDQVAFDRAATQMYGQPIQMDLISPMAQRLIRNQMAQFGIRIPELGMEASSYQRWARTQPQGTPTTIRGYLDYLRLRYGGTPYAQVPAQTAQLAP